jgi:hypothetical protein
MSNPEERDTGLKRLEAKLAQLAPEEYDRIFAPLAELVAKADIFRLPTLPSPPEPFRDPYGEALRQGLYERIEAVAAAGFSTENLAEWRASWREWKSQFSLADLEELAQIAEGGDGPTIEGAAQQSAVDRFATREQREAAIKRAAEKFGTVAEMATCFKVDYRDLRKWARDPGSLAKGLSVKAKRIEDGLLPYCPE